MLPALAVGYNSHAGNGLLGMGWNLGGLSAISRAGKDIYHEGEVSPVENIDNQDFYILDGNRLLLSSGTYGSSGCVYLTEEESAQNVSISSKTSVATGTNANTKQIIANATLYPNPTTGVLRVELDEASAMTYQLFDMTGRLVREGNAEATQRFMLDITQ